MASRCRSASRHYRAAKPTGTTSQSFVYVIVGEFILNTPNGALRRRPGETCMLDKDVDHAEEAGADGATILVTHK